MRGSVCHTSPIPQYAVESKSDNKMDVFRQGHKDDRLKVQTMLQYIHNHGARCATMFLRRGHKHLIERDGWTNVPLSDTRQSRCKAACIVDHEVRQPNDVTELCGSDLGLQ